MSILATVGDDEYWNGDAPVNDEYLDEDFQLSGNYLNVDHGIYGIIMFCRVTGLLLYQGCHT